MKLKRKSLNPSYVTDKDFRLMFLRCEHFIPKAAAKRMVGHFTIKRKLFGCPDIQPSDDATKTDSNTSNDDVHVLARPLVMSDLNDDDIALMESGFFQISPRPDAAGRGVVVFYPKPLRLEDVESAVR